MGDTECIILSGPRGGDLIWLPDDIFGRCAFLGIPLQLNDPFDPIEYSPEPNSDLYQGFEFKISAYDHVGFVGLKHAFVCRS